MEANLSTSSLDALLKTEPSLWRGRDRYNDLASIPTGFAGLDAALPSRGWHIGGVTELLLDQEGIGELSLLLPALRHVTADGQWAAFVNPPYIPYAPALSNAGVRPDRLLIIEVRMMPIPCGPLNKCYVPASLLALLSGSIKALHKSNAVCSWPLKWARPGQRFIAPCVQVVNIHQYQRVLPCPCKAVICRSTSSRCVAVHRKHSALIPQSLIILKAANGQSQ